jgi:PKD repeat protein
MRKSSGLFIGFLVVSIFCSYVLTLSPVLLSIEQNPKIETTNPKISNVPTPFIHYEFYNFSDSLNHSPNGIPIGNAYIVSNGIVGSGLFVQSETSEFIIPHVDGLITLDEFTIQFWFKQNEQQTITQNLIQKGNISSQSTFNIFRYPYDAFNTADVIAGHANEFGQWEQVSNPNSLNFGEWHLVTYVKAQEWHGYWIDAKQIYSTPIANQVYNSSDPIRIGLNAINLYFDELMIWNYVLDQQYIVEYYQEFFPMANFISDKLQVSLGESIQFYDTTAGGYPPYIYSWNFDDGTYSSEQNPVHVFNQIGKSEFFVTLTVSDFLGNTSSITKTIQIINNIGYFSLSSQNGDHSNDGRIRLNWTIAANATHYEVYEDNIYLATRNGNENWFEIIKSTPGTYSYYVKAWGNSGFRDSNTVIITTDTYTGAFSLWSEGVENPDRDGIFTLQWGESLNAEYFEIYEDNRLIHSMNGSIREFTISGKVSGVYDYYVKAKNSKGFFDSNRISITVSLNQNENKTDIPNNSGGDSMGNLLKFLQDNASFIAGGTAGVMALAVVLKILKGGKGKIKLKLPKAPLGDNINTNDDFFDSEL